MTLNELYKDLDYVNHSREKRAYYAQLIVDNPGAMRHVLEILFMVDDPRSNRAGWLAEFATKMNITIILPHLDYFTKHMHTVYQDSALRPVAKICEYLTISYYTEKHPETRKMLLSSHKNCIIECGFDWLITDQKVAVKAYTLTSLYHLGTETDWVHPELKRFMEDGYHTGSAAFKARCRHVKKWIKKFNKKQS
ncbi:adenylosuccinate lyase [Dokdonia sp. Asnod2-E02]|uniref:adenylosuccinate lyase n=1 Tax=Dokdonia sp. Asnod2-E02 TaxID=3160574 RepID=UPI00386AF35E